MAHALSLAELLARRKDSAGRGDVRPLGGQRSRRYAGALEDGPGVHNERVPCRDERDGGAGFSNRMSEADPDDPPAQLSPPPREG